MKEIINISPPYYGNTAGGLSNFYKGGDCFYLTQTQQFNK